MIITGVLNDKMIKTIDQMLEEYYPERKAAYSKRTQIICPKCHLCTLHKFSIRGNKPSINVFVCVHCFAVENRSKDRFFYKENELEEKKP